ncbi:MAG: TRAM domain-containing protein, partial [Acidobacteriota bacterium]
MVKKGQVVELTIESAAFEGSTVARHNDLVVFVRKAVPGDRLLAKIRRKRRRYAEASVEELLEPSPHRVEPRCRYFETCGGCTWQNYDYAQQLASKQQQVTDLFERIGDLDSLQVRPAIPSPETFYYRNKMEFTFGASRWLTREEIESGQPLERGFALGLHIPKRFDKILDLEECHLQSPRSAELVNFFRRLALDNGWSAYDSRSHIGYLRNLVIRTGTRTGELLVNLVTSRSEPQRMEQLCSQLLKAFPETTTFINSVNDT